MSVSLSTDIRFNLRCNSLSSASLKTLLSVVSTCLGPCGKLKLVQNVSGGCTTVTSTSRRLLDRLSIRSIVSKVVCSAVVSQLRLFNDNGLLCAVLALNLIENALPLEYPLPAVGALLGYLGRTYINCLQSENNLCGFHINFSNLTHLRCLVDSVLTSKPGCAMTTSDRNHLCNLLLKAFLRVFPLGVLDDGNIRFLFSGGQSVGSSRLYDGVLVKVPESTLGGVGASDGPFKTVVFSASLVGDVPPGGFVEGTSPSAVLKALLESAERVVKRVVTEGVQVVFCQKVIHPRLKKHLHNAKVFVFDKLGSEATRYVQYISGGNINSSLFSEMKCGSISHIQKETVGRDHYLRFCNSNNALFTMVLCNYSEEAGQEMMVVSRQAIDALFRVLRSSRVCFGAGCTEIYSAHLLATKVQEDVSVIQEETGCSRGELQVTLQSFLRSIAATSVAIHQGSQLDFKTETKFGHLWKLGADRCACGCISSGDIPESSWMSLSDIGVSSETPTTSCGGTTAALDELSCKVGSYSRSIETAAMLLQTTLVVNNSQQQCNV